jgi:Tat protein secretion system quality control protein TatD with DNase activity
LDKHLNRKSQAPKTDHLLLTETDNPDALKWLNKNDKIGMPTAIQNVVDKVAEMSAVDAGED